MSTMQIRTWQIGQSYAAGDLVTYNGTMYKALVAQVAVAVWTSALWQPVAASSIVAVTAAPTTTVAASAATVTTVKTAAVTVKAAAAPLPSVPTGLTVAQSTDTAVTLQWNPSTIASGGTVTGYAVFQNGTQIATTTAPLYSVTGLNASTAYTFSVDAIASTGSSAQTAALAVTTKVAGSGNNLAFSPYIDMSIWTPQSLVAISQSSGIKNFTLAFVTSTGTNSIGWQNISGSSITNDKLPNGATMQSEVQALQAAGGSVTISFGGPNGTDPAMAASSASALQAMYQSVINRYHVTKLDFYITGAAETNAASLALRNTALLALKAANPGLTISFSLPTNPTGLDANGLNVITKAVAAGLTPNIVNLLTSDYNTQVDQGGNMSLDAIDAALGTEKLFQAHGITSKIGITPMIGLNNVTPETFSLTDAQNVVNFTKSDPNIALLSMWSVTRDNGNSAGATTPTFNSSGIAQSQYAFAQIFETAPPPPPVPTVPTGLSVAASSSTSVTLQWNPSTVPNNGTVTGYAVFQNGTQIATTTVPLYSVTGLTAGTAYSFTVDAIGANGASATASPLAVTTPAANVASQAVFAPYVDISVTSAQNLIAIAQASGIKTFTLAFIQSSGMNSIAWGGTGTTSITNDVLTNGTTVLSQVQMLQAAGINVIISFGGSAGTDPAMAASSASALQAMYQSVINRYGVTSLDFDIEGTPETDAASIALRNTALAGLKAANPGLTISFTLPTTPTGLDAKGLNVVTSAVAAGVTPNIVNLMTADYNSQVDQGGAMGLDAIDAALGTEKQFASLGVTSKLGITPMIGLNDVLPETFTLANAQQVVNYVKSDPDIARIAMWSVARDNGSGAGGTTPNDTSSGISQSAYAFSSIFETADTTPPLAQTPSVPTGLNAAASSDTGVTLTWNPSAVIAGGGTVTGYAVFRNGTQIATTTVPLYSVTGLTANTAYSFTVDATGSAGASAQTSALMVTTKAAGAGGNVSFAPYIDMSIYTPLSLAAISQTSGIKTFTLAFIQSTGRDSIGWANTSGTSITNDVLPNGTTMLSQVQGLQAAGGSVIISFGGSNGTDPAMAASSASALQATYQSVINRYHVSSLDFDLQGTSETDAASIALRNTALAGLKASNPGLTISFTLPTTPSGLDAKGLNVVTSAVTAGVTPDVVNLLTSDYNSQVDQGAAMGLDAIDAALGTEKQFQSLGVTSKIGITPMIGINDVSSEIFTLANAQQVVDYIKSDPNIARLGMWSVARDNGSGAGATAATYNNSGIAQDPYAFSHIFESV